MAPRTFAQKAAKKLSASLPIAAVPHRVMRVVQGKYTERPQSGGGRAALWRTIDAQLSRGGGDEEEVAQSR